jgi:hypothetical protein
MGENKDKAWMITPLNLYVYDNLFFYYWVSMFIISLVVSIKLKWNMLI